MGSVKDLSVSKEPKDTYPGIGIFTFSDRYSVFDWGEMPDHIKNKGRALCIIGAYFFERLNDLNINNHYRRLYCAKKPVTLSELKKPTDSMVVNILHVLKPELKGNNYDYSEYKHIYSNYLVPLEVIYRNTLPPGSSIFKRLDNGGIHLKDFGLEKKPVPGQKLKEPFIEFSTKLEITDRFITQDEARDISGLGQEEIERIKELTLLINALITSELDKVGLANEDGKLEFGIDGKRRILVVDVFGTLDECRFTYDDKPVSKEIARDFYRDSTWYKQAEKAKKKDRVNWKSLVKTAPPPLPERLCELISQAYQASCNGITGKQWFDVPTLQEILQEINYIRLTNQKKLNHKEDKCQSQINR